MAKRDLGEKSGAALNLLIGPAAFILLPRKAIEAPVDGVALLWSMRNKWHSLLTLA